MSFFFFFFSINAKKETWWPSHSGNMSYSLIVLFKMIFLCQTILVFNQIDLTFFMCVSSEILSNPPSPFLSFDDRATNTVVWILLQKQIASYTLQVLQESVENSSKLDFLWVFALLRVGFHPSIITKQQIQKSQFHPETKKPLTLCRH